jgi:hypothetical protein
MRDTSVMASAVQFACGVFAIATPVLLAAGYYSQVLLDRLGDGRDLLVLAVTTVGALVGEAAALIGLLRPQRPLEAIAAFGTAVSAAGVVLVPVYALRLRARRRSRSAPPQYPAPQPPTHRQPAHRQPPYQPPPFQPPYPQPPNPPTEMRSAPPWGGADRDRFGFSR